MMSALQRIKITSDGYVHNTHIQTEDGRHLLISKATISIDAETGIVDADLHTVLVELDVLADARIHPQVICPACGQLYGIEEQGERKPE